MFALRSIDAPVGVLDEVDFDCSWSRDINQARELAQRAGYPDWVEQRNIDVRVAFWKWRFGNAILSKHPTAQAEMIDLPAYSKTETTLGGKKRRVLCEIQRRIQSIRVAGVHLSHRSERVRVASAQLLADMAAQSPYPFFVLGDPNSTPPDFPHSVSDDHGQNTITVFDESQRFNRAPTSTPNEEGMTFSLADSPGRDRLDSRSQQVEV